MMRTWPQPTPGSWGNAIFEPGPDGSVRVRNSTELGPYPDHVGLFEGAGRQALQQQRGAVFAHLIGWRQDRREAGAHIFGELETVEIEQVDPLLGGGPGAAASPLRLVVLLQPAERAVDGAG
jgi:hypothetical protein